MRQFIWVPFFAALCMGCATEEQTDLCVLEKPPAATLAQRRSFIDSEATTNVAGNHSEYVFTASQDGRRIYMWQRVGSKPPRFVGDSNAVLSQ